MRQKKEFRKIILFTLVLLVLVVGAFAVKDSLKKILVVELPLNVLHVKEYIGELVDEPEIREQNPDAVFIIGPNFTFPETQQSTETELLLREQYESGTINEETCSQQTQFKDKCYLLLARQSNNANHCLEVEDTQKKDSCLMNHILTKNNFEQQDLETCSEINNTYLQQSCVSLNQLHNAKT